MLHFRPIISSAVFTMTVLACASSTGPSSGVVATLVAAARDAGGIVHVEVDWRNVGAVPVYLSGCGGQASMSLERRASTGWVGFGGGICLANLDQTPLRVGPNESVRAAVGVGPGDPGEYRGVISVSDRVGGAGRVVQSEAARVP